MVRYGEYLDDLSGMVVYPDWVDLTRFMDRWQEVTGGEPLGVMWREVLAAAHGLGVGVRRASWLIPDSVLFEDVDGEFVAWALFCERLWDACGVDVSPVGAAA